MSDPRFSKSSVDPRFHRQKVRDTKIAVDDRFKGLFDSSSGKRRLDRYGRKVGKDKDREELRRFYRLEGDEVDEDKEASTSAAARVPDYARGEVILPHSDDSTTDTDSGSSESDSDSDAELALGPRSRSPSISTSASLSDYSRSPSPAPALSDDEDEGADEGSGDIPPTKRLALTNLDWDNLTAQDLYVALSSVLDQADAPPGGRLVKVEVFKSEFGKKRMEEEERSGPQLAGVPSGKRKAEKGKENDEDALRRYQLDRLKYHYAVVHTSSAKASGYLLTEANNTELERTANLLNFSVVPNDVTFDEADLRDEADTGSEGYKGVDFVTSALRHSKVQLTWDADDANRNAITRKRLTKAEIDQADFKAYLASDSEESEDEAENARRAALLRAALGNGAPDVHGGRGQAQGEMEVTFAPGLSERKALEEGSDGEREETTLERYKRKERERKARRKEKRDATKRGERVADSGDEQQAPRADAADAEGFDDPFFASDNDYPPPSSRSPSPEPAPSSRKKKSSRRRSPSPSTSRPASTAAELALLAEGADDKHFDMDEIVRAEKAAKRRGGKKDKKTKKLAEEAKKDTFELDLGDARFRGVLEDHEFAIDPSAPNFKPTKNMSKLLSERTRRAAQSNGESVFGAKNAGSAAGERSLESLVESVRKKSAALGDEDGAEAKEGSGGGRRRKRRRTGKKEGE